MSIFKSIQGTLNSWKGRGFTLIGKIQIVKSFIIPKFLSKVALISVPEDHVREINKLIYHFVWKGKIKSNDLSQMVVENVRYSFNDLHTVSNGIKKIRRQGKL